jgi:hypothetical protein
VSEEIGRRAFVGRTVAVGAIWGMRNLCGATPQTLRIGVVSDAAAGSTAVILGARLGADEASRGAALFGAGPVELTVGSFEEVLAGDVAALVAAKASMADCLRLANVAAERGKLFVNSTCADDAFARRRLSRFGVSRRAESLDVA